MADDDHLLATAGDRGSDVFHAGSWGQPLIRLRVDFERLCQLAPSFTRAQEGAREDRLGTCILAAEALAQLASLPAALPGQRAELVGLARRCFGMAHEVEAHDA